MIDLTKVRIYYLPAATQIFVLGLMGWPLW